MIDFYIWLKQIIRYCDLIVEGTVLRNAWVFHDMSKTSITDFDELCEQIFDDLDSEQLVNDFRKDFRDEELFFAIKNFLDVFLRFESVQMNSDSMQDLTVLLNSEEWKVVKLAANLVLSKYGKQSDRLT